MNASAMDVNWAALFAYCSSSLDELLVQSYSSRFDRSLIYTEKRATDTVTSFPLPVWRRVPAQFAHSRRMKSKRGKKFIKNSSPALVNV